MRAPRPLVRTLAAAALALGTVAGTTALAPGASAADSPYCGIRWGSLPEAGGDLLSDGHLTGVRTGRHACFDRLVVDVAGDVAGYRARYAPVHLEGSGHPLPLRGAGDLEIIVGAPVAQDGGFPRPGAEIRNVSGYSTFRQISHGGSFEGQTTIGLGVRARLPFRVLVLDGPGDGSRVVVDVAHRW